MTKAIQNSITKTGMVSWRMLRWLQNKNLKEMTIADMEKLKKSLIENGFTMAFHIWEPTENELYIIDGCHRRRILDDLEKEGYFIPDELPAVWVDCKDKQDAMKKVLIFSSIYAKVTPQGLYETLENYSIDFNEIKNEIDLANFDSGKFQVEYYKDLEIKEPEKKEVVCPKCGYVMK